ncbi:MAG: flagellar basal body-associated FliL family protein [Sideroxydans sp.]|nr:flagellar basal body-associated FliL family protein [Sideroxydans sp.]
MEKLIRLLMRVGLLGALCLVAPSSFASGGGGGGEAGASAYTRLDPFTVNLQGLKQVIQVAITLKMAKPEAAEKAKLYMPAIRNDIIYLLSSKTPEQLGTPEGKERLLVETRRAVNKALELNSKEGVAEVLFESIIIQ